MANFGLTAKIFRAYGSSLDYSPLLLRSQLSDSPFLLPIIQLASSNGLRLNGPLIKLIAFPPMKTTSQMHAQKRNQRTEKPIPLSHGFPRKLEGGKQSRQILPSLHGTLLERLQSINLDHNIYYIRVLKGISANLPNDAKTRRMRIWSIWLLQGPKPLYSLPWPFTGLFSILPTVFGCNLNTSHNAFSFWGAFAKTTTGDVLLRIYILHLDVK